MTQEHRDVLDELVLSMASALARERIDFGGRFASVTVGDVDLAAIRAALEFLDGEDARISAEREATWRHAAKVVDYETGRDLDILEDAFNEDIARPLRETRRDAQ